MEVAIVIFDQKFKFTIKEFQDKKGMDWGEFAIKLWLICNPVSKKFEFI